MTMIIKIKNLMYKNYKIQIIKDTTIKITIITIIEEVKINHTITKEITTTTLDTNIKNNTKVAILTLIKEIINLINSNNNML